MTVFSARVKHASELVLSAHLMGILAAENWFDVRAFEAAIITLCSQNPEITVTGALGGPARLVVDPTVETGKCLFTGFGAVGGRVGVIAVTGRSVIPVGYSCVGSVLRFGIRAWIRRAFLTPAHDQTQAKQDYQGTILHEHFLSKAVVPDLDSRPVAVGACHFFVPTRLSPAA
jgi:hypothetical protein